MPGNLSLFGGRAAALAEATHLQQEIQKLKVSSPVAKHAQTPGQQKHFAN